MIRHVALCVDDFALHAGIDAAVLLLAGQRRINAVSCIVTAKRWRAAGAALRELDQEATDVGLHVDLTEHPFDAAVGGSLSACIARAWTRRLPRARLRAEIEAQIDAFEAVTGRPPAHVDGHQHVHQFPGVREALIEALSARYPPAQRPWLRSTQPPPGAGVKARIIDGLGGAALRALARDAGLTTSGRMLGVRAFDADRRRYLKALAVWLAAARDGDVLVCHPALPTAGVDDPIAPARHLEAEVLCGEAFAQMLAGAGIVLAPLRHHPG